VDVCQAETTAVLLILLRFGAAIIAIVQLTTARERDLSIKWFLEVRAMVFQATSQALGLHVEGPDLVGQTVSTANQQQEVPPGSSLIAGSNRGAPLMPGAAPAEALPPHLHARSSDSDGAAP
jgi:uncharacterized membrane protein